jgi:Arc/MetJ-type ribon-helix-helix transcriptional regulator
MAQTTEKLTITLPRPLAEGIHHAVAAGTVPSASAYIAEAVQRWQLQESLAALVADMIAEHGSPSPEDYAWADEVLGGS